MEAIDLSNDVKVEQCQHHILDAYKDQYLLDERYGRQKEILEKQIKALQQKQDDADQTGTQIVEVGKSLLKQKNESEIDLINEKLGTIKAILGIRQKINRAKSGNEEEDNANRDASEFLSGIEDDLLKVKFQL